MCGRFTQVVKARELAALYGPAVPMPDTTWAERWNGAPTQAFLVCRLEAAGRRVLSLQRWGLLREVGADHGDGDDAVGLGVEPGGLAVDDRRLADAGEGVHALVHRPAPSPAAGRLRPVRHRGHDTGRPAVRGTGTRQEPRGPGACRCVRNAAFTEAFQDDDAERVRQGLCRPR